MDKKARYPVVIAFAMAISSGAMLKLTQQHEGTGPVEVVPVEEAIKRGAIGDVGMEAEADFVKLVTTHEIAITHAYPDPGYGWKIPTICYGHTRGVKQGMTATMEQCDAWLIEDYRAIVLPALKKCVLAPVSKGEAAGLGSFTFNLGETKMCGSTLVRYVNAGQYRQAADEFTKWTKSNGKVMGGLVKRRAAERDIFLNG
jgi:lysozyme